MGDGAIVEFASVVDAVACAVAVQKAVATQQTGVPTERRIVFRVGVNLGDVVVEGDDLLGDGVNVAARLEQLCAPGGVLVSGTAYDHLQGKLECSFEYSGERQLKNIERPVRVYRVASDGAAPAAALVATPAKPVVAVLPLANMSGDPEQAYFSDGISEDIITELAGSASSWSSPATPPSPSAARKWTCARSAAHSAPAMWSRGAYAGPETGSGSPPS
jgi:hypothetical protein